MWVLNEWIGLFILSHPKHHWKVLKNLRFILNAHPWTLKARLPISRQGPRKLIDMKHLIDSQHQSLIFVRYRPSILFLPRFICRRYFRVFSSWIPHIMRLSSRESKSRLLINLLDLVNYRLIAEICLITVVSAHIHHTFSSISILSLGPSSWLILLWAHLMLQGFERSIICMLEDFPDVELLRLEWLELVLNLAGCRSLSLGSERLHLETVVVLYLHF